MRFRRKKRPAFADELRGIAVTALAAALEDGLLEASKKKKEKSGLSPLRAAAAGAALYTAGRVAYKNRHLLDDLLEEDEEDEEIHDAEAIEDEEEAEGEEDLEDEDVEEEEELDEEDEPEAEEDLDDEDVEDELEAESDEEPPARARRSSSTSRTRSRGSR